MGINFKKETLSTACDPPSTHTIQNIHYSFKIHITVNRYSSSLNKEVLFQCLHLYSEIKMKRVEDGGEDELTEEVMLGLNNMFFCCSNQIDKNIAV